MVDSATEKEKLLKSKLRTVGNYVHDSVPVSNNEVREQQPPVCRGLVKEPEEHLTLTCFTQGP